MEDVKLQNITSDARTGIMNTESKRVFVEDIHHIEAPTYFILTNERDWKWLKQLFPTRNIQKIEFRSPSGHLIPVRDATDLRSNDCLYITFEH